MCYCNFPNLNYHTSPTLKFPNLRAQENIVQVLNIGMDRSKQINGFYRPTGTNKDFSMTDGFHGF